MIQIGSTSTLLFVVLLTSRLHFTSSQPAPSPQDPFAYFVYRLEQVINASAPDVLPFSLKARVINDWLQTSNEFKDLCLHCESVLRNRDTYTPVMALMETINRTFHHYIYSTNRNFFVLESIRSADPVGFNAYLTHNNVTNSSPDFMQHALIFQATMNGRVRLLNMKTNDSCFDIFDGSSSSAPQNFFSPTSIPPIARDEFATEDGPISENSMDSFTDLLSETMPTRMYRVGTTIDDYQEHSDPESDDIQIINDVWLPHEDNRATLIQPICFHYKAFDRTVFVFGKVKRAHLHARQKAIIDQLYPFKTNIIYDSVSAFERKHPAGGIFAIMYATILVLHEDPTRAKFKMNKVWGDETLYMRIHILNMLANQKVTLAK